MCRATLNQKPPELKTDPNSPRKPPAPKGKIKKFMNPSSQQYTTRITTKKITNLFHSCSMQHSRSEFSQRVVFSLQDFASPTPSSPPQPQSFPEPVQEPRNWLQVPHSHTSKGQIIQLEKMVARPHPPRLQHLRRSGARRKRTQANQILDTRTNIAAHSRARSTLRRSLGRAVFHLIARSLARRAFVCSQGTSKGSPPFYRPA